MNKLHEYLDVFKEDSPRKEFTFGLIIYCDASKVELAETLQEELTGAVIIHGNIDENRHNAEILSSIQAGKVVVVDIIESINEGLRTFLSTVYERDLGPDYDLIDKSSIIIKVHANNYKNLMIGGIEFYTCNLLRE